MSFEKSQLETLEPKNEAEAIPDTELTPDEKIDAVIQERKLSNKLAWEEAATKYGKRWTPSREEMRERMEGQNIYLASLKPSAPLSEEEINSELDRLYPKG